MSGFTRATWSAQLLVAALLTACRTNEPLTPIPAVSSITNTRAASTSGGPRSLDDELFAVAQQSPGFAGLVLGTGDSLVILTTAQADRRAVRAAVNGYASARGMTSTRGTAWRDVRYDFATLYRVKQSIRSLRIPGLRFVDLAEDENRVVLGVGSSRDSIEASSLLTKVVDSSSAVTIRVVPPIKQAALLTDFVRPLAAGLQITTEYGTSCTAGPIARFSSGDTRYMVVNSHCTSSPWSYDGSVAHQPFVWNPWGTRIGVEYADRAPYWEPDGCGYWSEYCRNSDAALVRLDSVAPYKIARTTWVSITPGVSGSLTLASDGNFTTTGVVPWSNLIVNQGLHKVGRTTGWTFGTITRTCVDVYVVASPNDFVLLCQFAANGAVAGGDSGSPVFQWYGAAPSYDSYVAGILWGYYNSSEYVFSAWQSVTADFGMLYPHP